MVWFCLPAFLIAFVYGVVMILFLKGWGNISSAEYPLKSPGSRLSVIIATRNEEDRVSQLIDSLVHQDYPKDKQEIILVDDHSGDSTLSKMKDMSDEYSHIRVFKLPEGMSGKKEALRYGHSKAGGDILLLTDADCLPGPLWMKSMHDACSRSRGGLIIGPVKLAPAVTIFEKIQQLDYMSMVMSGAGSIGIGRPILAFGPNLAIGKELYGRLVKDIKVGIPSGDDMFVLEAAKKIPGTIIDFVKDETAIVTSPPAPNLKKFWNQRKRWVSKSGAYRDADIIQVSILVYLMNLSIFTCLILGLFSLLPLWISAILLVCKTVFEYPLIRKGAEFFNIKGTGLRFLFTQIFYFIYIVLILPAGMSGNYRWKSGR